MDKCLGRLRDENVRCYLDDIIMSALTFSEHLNQICQVLKKLCDVGLYINVNKLKIFQKEVRVLGHVVSENGICADPKKVEALLQARCPSNKKELRSFIATASYLRRFVPNFSEIVAPLTDLGKKRAAWIWSDVEANAFEALRQDLSTVVGLSIPRGVGPFILLCDASDKGVGVALAQVQEGEVVLLEFASQKFSSTQKNWATREREAYAVVFAAERFASYLCGHRVIVLTDHQSLLWLDHATAGKLARWSLRLQQYQLEVAHLAGEFNCVADFLSRTVDDDPFALIFLEEVCLVSFACCSFTC
eukprot:GHVQ01042585.1.p1 GENE.GHVQ01042585.1~~GHVQ01042585.1.p1  ORF type:complete len:304 (+),score=22.05 GHVQ01042585.1:164-1075(+)